MRKKKKKWLHQPERNHAHPSPREEVENPEERGMIPTLLETLTVKTNLPETGD
jgi:hypothetical protein